MKIIPCLIMAFLQGALNLVSNQAKLFQAN